MPVSAHLEFLVQRYRADRQNWSSIAALAQEPENQNSETLYGWIRVNSTGRKSRHWHLLKEGELVVQRQAFVVLPRQKHGIS
jgi:hypothetical protein